VGGVKRGGTDIVGVREPRNRDVWCSFKVLRVRKESQAAEGSLARESRRTRLQGES